MRKASCIFKSLLAFFVLQLFLTSYVSAQQIITDGNTNTTLDIVQGNWNTTTNVTTTTIKGNNAFNSFKKFNVDPGNIVNLVVPDNATNLINIVKNEATYIDGILNSLKSGVTGGNIYIANPAGIFIGTKNSGQGRINVGSLTAITPTQAFVNNFFTAPGNPDPNSVNALLNGTAPINSAADIINHSSIYNPQKVELIAGRNISTYNIEMTDDLVNHDHLTDGTIIIKAGSAIEIVAPLRTAGTVNLTAGSGGITETMRFEDPNIVAKSVVITSGNNIGSLKNDINIGYVNRDNPSVEVTATAPNDICLTMNDGNFKLNNINSSNGHVYITSRGDILNNRTDNNPVISGKDISLNANYGNLGANKFSPLTINSGNGVVTALGKEVFLTETAGDIFINLIRNWNKVVVRANGSILPATNASSIVTHDLTLISDNGKIGADNPINVTLGDNDDGILEAVSADDINIKAIPDSYYQRTRFLNLRKVESKKGDVTINNPGGLRETADHSPITVKGHNINLLSLDNGGIIGTTTNNPLNIDLINGGALNAQAGWAILINEVNGNLNLDLVSNAGKDLIKLNSAKGNITSNGVYNAAILGKYLNFNALNGSINTSLMTDAKTVLEAYAQGSISLTQPVGDLYYTEIKSTLGDASLTAKAGSILSTKIDPIPIYGININLKAAKNIGIFERQPIIIDLNNGALNAQAYGQVYIREFNGDLNIDKVNNPAKSITRLVTWQGNIVSNGNNTPAVIAHDLYLESREVDLTIDTTGYVDSLSSNITLREINGDLKVRTIKSGNTVNITSDNGSILPYNAEQNTFIRGENINLVAAKDIGNPFYNAYYNPGGIVIDHHDAVVSAKTFNGSINLESPHENIRLHEIIAPNGNVRLVAGRSVGNAGFYNSKINTRSIIILPPDMQTLNRDSIFIKVNKSCDVNTTVFKDVYIQRY